MGVEYHPWLCTYMAHAKGSQRTMPRLVNHGIYSTYNIIRPMDEWMSMIMSMLTTPLRILLK